MDFYSQPAYAVIFQVGYVIGGVIVSLIGLAFLFVAIRLAWKTLTEARDYLGRRDLTYADGDELAWSATAASLAVLILFFAYSIFQGGSPQATSEVGGTDPQEPSTPASKLEEPKPEEPKPEEPKPEEPKPEEPKPEEPKPEEPKPEEPITIKSTTCLVKDAKTSKPRMSTAEISELLVTVAVPSNARECHDTVTIDAPTFGLGKEPSQSVSVIRPQESHEARWLLDPEKPGTWNIAVETKRDRELVPIAVTTPLGFTATWVQVGVFISAASVILFGAIGLFRRR